MVAEGLNSWELGVVLEDATVDNYDYKTFGAPKPPLKG